MNLIFNRRSNKRDRAARAAQTLRHEAERYLYSGDPEAFRDFLRAVLREALADQRRVA